MAFEGARGGEIAHTHQVIDDQIHRFQRGDEPGFAVEVLRDIAHGGKIHDS